MVFTHASGTLLEDRDDSGNVPFFGEPFHIPNIMQDIDQTDYQTPTTLFE